LWHICVSRSHSIVPEHGKSIGEWEQILDSQLDIVGTGERSSRTCKRQQKQHVIETNKATSAINCVHAKAKLKQELPFKTRKM